VAEENEPAKKLKNYVPTAYRKNDSRGLRPPFHKPIKVDVAAVRLLSHTPNERKRIQIDRFSMTWVKRAF